jgi:beta-glucanase (GH16 family)
MASTFDLTGFTLTFDDEFNGLSASADGVSTTWQTSYFWGERYLPANGEKQFYSDATTGTNPFVIRNGALEITAEPGSNPGGQPYTSGMLQSYHSFSQTYGYFEMRAELPQGQGMWPAFWLLPSNGASGEIDIMEAFGAPNGSAEGGSNQTHWAEHFASPNEAGNWATVTGDIYTGYHTYGVDWEPDKITWYFDGEQIAQEATPSGAHDPMYVLANLAVGGNWPGPPGGETAHMDIDYIRVYSKAPNATAVALQPISSPDAVDTTPSGAMYMHSGLAPNSTADASLSGTDTPQASSEHTPVHQPTGNGHDHGHVHWSVSSAKPAGPDGLSNPPAHADEGNPMGHDSFVFHRPTDHRADLGPDQDTLHLWQLWMMNHTGTRSPTDHIPGLIDNDHAVAAADPHGGAAHTAHGFLTLAHVVPTASHMASEHYPFH